MEGGLDSAGAVQEASRVGCGNFARRVAHYRARLDAPRLEEGQDA